MKNINRILNKIISFTLNKIGKVNRVTIARHYISGSGIEIGAMDLPLKVPKNSSVKYLDRCSREDSVKIFPYLAGKLVPVDIIDDGEILATVPNSSQDFIIANHFIEHTQNPISTIENLLRVIYPGGVVFMAIPDKRFTFDHLRKNTSLEHFCKDYEEGPSWSEQHDYYDFVKFTEHGIGKSDEEIGLVIEDLKERNFSIHFHVWDHTSMLEMFLMLKSKYNFPFEIVLAQAPTNDGNESIFILKKNYD